MAVLLTVGAALVLVFVVISAYFCLTRRPGPPPPNSRRKNSNNNKPDQTHVPLHDASIDADVVAITDLSRGSKVVSSPSDLDLDDEDKEARVGLVSSLTASTSCGDEMHRNPDLIPIQARGNCKNII